MEAVKQLKELMDVDDNVSPHLAETSVVAVCDNPLLPQVFRPVCKARGTGLVFSTLGKTEPSINRGIIVNNEDTNPFMLCCLVYPSQFAL